MALCRTIGPLLSQRCPLVSAKAQPRGDFYEKDMVLWKIFLERWERKSPRKIEHKDEMKILSPSHLRQVNVITGKMDNPVNDQKDESTKIRRPERWTHKDCKATKMGKGVKGLVLALNAPRKLAFEFWTRKAGFSIMSLEGPKYIIGLLWLQGLW